MNYLSRRSLLAAGALAPSLPLPAAGFTRPLGVQLYTVRTILPKDPRGTLSAIAGMGYTFVEPGRGQLAQLAPLLKELQLASPSIGLDTPLVTGNWNAWGGAPANAPQTLAEALGQIRAAGARFAVVAYVMKSERAAPGFFEKFADQMNHAGQECRKHGIQLCYHHHSFEFNPAGGKRPFDVLVDRFDPKLVRFEIDVFWMKMGGEDPAAMLKKLKGRVALVHLKDIAKGSPVEYDEAKVPREAFKEVGNGAQDWTAILPACAAAGVEHYIVEQDWWPGSPLASLKQSYAFLRALK